MHLTLTAVCCSVKIDDSISVNIFLNFEHDVCKFSQNRSLSFEDIEFVMIFWDNPRTYCCITLKVNIIELHCHFKTNKSLSYQDTPPPGSFLVCILNFDKTSKIFSKCIHLFGRYLGETHFVHKSWAITQLKNKEKQNVIG